MTPPTFRTQRLTLRPWTLEDVPQFVHLLQDEGFRSFSNLQPMNSEEARHELKTRLTVCTRPGFGFWAIVDEGRICGVIQLKDQSLDDGRSLPEMGYRLHRECWGRGYVTEVGGLLRDYAMDDLGVNPLHLFIDKTNTRSQAVAQRLGFHPGESARFKGFDVVIWSRSTTDGGANAAHQSTSEHTGEA